MMNRVVDETRDDLAYVRDRRRNVDGLGHVEVDATTTRRVNGRVAADDLSDRDRVARPGRERIRERCHGLPA
jgi:hypothetical protein